MSVTTKVHEFTLVLAGVEVCTTEMADALFEAGCDDCSPGSWGGAVYVHFDREADSLGKAIGTAIEDVERAGFSVARVEVEAGPLGPG